MMGRELCGLPVFSLAEDRYLGRVADFYIHSDDMRLTGISLGKVRAGRRLRWFSAGSICRIYRDGVIVLSSSHGRTPRFIGENNVSYHEFTAASSIFLPEGEVVSDLIFDESFTVAGYEISGGLWKDLSEGRRAVPRR